MLYSNVIAESIPDRARASAPQYGVRERTRPISASGVTIAAFSWARDAGAGLGCV